MALLFSCFKCTLAFANAILKQKILPVFLSEKVACALAVTKLPTAHVVPQISCLSEQRFNSDRKHSGY